MIDLKMIYNRSETFAQKAVFGLFVLLGFLLVLQSIISPAFVVAFVLAVSLLLVTILRPLWSLFLLAVYLPFESIILKFTPDDAYLFARYLSEGLVYLVLAVVVVKILTNKIEIRQSPIDLPFFLFGVVLLASSLINAVSPWIAVLGIRQIIRFMLVFFLVVHLRPTKEFIKNLLLTMFFIVVFQSVLGLMQWGIGESLDAILLPSEARNYGSIVLTEGVQQFWEPGTRIFSTLGRYDRLGNFLYIFLLMTAGFAFVKKSMPDKLILGLSFLVGLPALLLTYSRSSWFAFIIGFLFIGVYLMKNKKIALFTGAIVIVLAGYIAASGLQVRFITESPGQTITERFYESFSYARWRGEYYGLGRVFWYVHTPLTVVPSSPIFGVGPGQFGGGAVTALGNSKVYEELGLPFGVFGTEGFIDNNWFALWGETGTLGWALYIWMFAALFTFGVKTFRESKDPFVRAVAVGVCAVILGISFNAFTSTVFEIRTSAYYLWLLAGCMVVLRQREIEGAKNKV